jgi:hypothetical protein
VIHGGLLVEYLGVARESFTQAPKTSSTEFVTSPHCFIGEASALTGGTDNPARNTAREKS